ncbi:MAG: hypothetical protein HZB46_12410 [Solirubrobacterales bacterium]|nr:hypothetical protein [Solirubrobacterales bacterium]
MRRRRTLLLVAVAVVVVGAAGVALAAFLSTESRERDRIADVLRAEARGDAAAVQRLVQRCDDGCSFVQRVRGPGAVKIARLDSDTAYALGGAEGWTRVVWVHGVTSRPFVQCVLVRRGGSLWDRSIELVRLRAPLADNEGSC